jgi:hypothetical protein
MTAIFEMSLPSETLSEEELSEISGCSRKTEQIDWLSKNGWLFVKTKGNEPRVGRLYARLKLAGINPAALAAPEASGWQLDVANIR